MMALRALAANRWVLLTSSYNGAQGLLSDGLLVLSVCAAAARRMAWQVCLLSFCGISYLVPAS
jgi:hypothetical protein